MNTPDGPGHQTDPTRPSDRPADPASATFPAPDPIIVHTIRDERTLACPLCDFTVDVPPVPVIDDIGAALGMSGQTLALVHAEQSAKRASAQMREHLKRHDVVEWLRWVNLAQPVRLATEEERG